MKLSSNIVNTTVSDDVDKIATALNNPLQFKIPEYVLSRNRSTHDIMVHGATDEEPFNNVKGEIDKQVSDAVNKLLIEDLCDLTSQEELSTDETKEFADSLNLKLRDECRERGMRYKRDVRYECKRAIATETSSVRLRTGPSC